MTYHDTWLPAPRATADQLTGFRIGGNNGVYGPQLPPQMLMERFTKAFNAFMERKRLNPDPIIVHPAIFQRWVDEGWITADGQWKMP